MSKLHDDLVAIRKKRKMSVQDIHDKTRLAMNTIRQIEDGSIFEAESNKTYTRSYVRTYARGLGMNDNDMIQALDLREGGMYDGFLRYQYTGEKPPKPAQPPAESKPVLPSTPPPTQENSADPVDADPSDAKSIPTPGKEPSNPVQSEPSTKAEKNPEGNMAPMESKPRVLDGSTIGPGKTGPVKIRNARHTTPPPPTSADVDWSNLRLNTKRHGKDIPVLPIAGGIIILLLLVFGIFWLLNSDSDPDDTTGLTPETGITEEREATGSEFNEMLADTLDAPVPPDPSIAAATVLPDTLSVVVYAATGNLEPFRVRSDTFENRRPYWIEQGVGMRIAFVNEMTLTGNFNRMLVLYNDRVITEFDEIDVNGERILRRSQFEDDPSLESFTNTELPDGISEPRQVIARPIIN